MPHLRMLAAVTILAAGGAGAAQIARSADLDETVIVGPVRVIDGDTLEIDGQVIRLAGIDAPEEDQTCENADGGEWLCGVTAMAHLEWLVDRRDVHCQGGFDVYGRLLAVCHVDRIRMASLNELMVLHGMAVAYPRMPQYRASEAFARSRRERLWSGSFVQPWDWRDGKREWAYRSG